MTDVSIVIRTKNQRQYLEESLPKIWMQRLAHSFEVIVVDSGSADDVLTWTRRVCEGKPAQILQIRPEDFGFSFVLNRGIGIASGEYVVCLSGDAVPRDEFWLASMIRWFEDSDIAGVYGKQIPRSSAHLIERKKLDARYGDEPKKEWRKHIFSNANSAFRRSLALKFPFDESLPVCEDYDWAKRMQEQGYAIGYEPHAVVYHSHQSRTLDHIRRIIEFRVWRYQIDHHRPSLEARARHPAIT